MIQISTDMIRAAQAATQCAPAECDECIARAIEAALAVLSAGWLIWSNEHQMWWKSDRAGYTADLMCAGRYPLEDALAETGKRKTRTGLPGEVVVRAPHVSLIGNRDVAGMMRASVEAATRQAVEAAYAEDERDAQAWRECAHRADYPTPSDHANGCAFHRGEVDEWGRPLGSANAAGEGAARHG